MNNDCNLQAIQSGGTTAWTTNVGTDPNSGACNSFVPDFQGGAIVYNSQSIYKLDGQTGHAYPAYTAEPNHILAAPLVHTDGTIFTIDSYSASSQNSDAAGGYSSSSTSYGTIVAIDPLTGQPKFSIDMDSYSNSMASGDYPAGYHCGGGSPLPPVRANASSSNFSSSAPTWGIIAGDGYLYAWDEGGSSVSYGQEVGYGQYWWQCMAQSNSTSVAGLSLLRVGTDGDSSEIGLANTSLSSNSVSYIEVENPPSPINVTSGTTLGPSNLITNADQGVLATYEIDTCSGNCTGSNFSQAFYVATTSGTGMASNTQATSVPGQTAPLNPVLQRADNSYVGTVSTSSGNPMVAFTSSGGTLWTGPNDTPQIATSGGGVIGTSGTTYDQNGNVTGQIASVPAQSWIGNSYQMGSIDQVAETAIIAASLWAWQGGNPSGTGTAGRPWFFILNWQNQFDFIPDVPDNLPQLKTDITYDATAIKTAALAALKQAFSQNQWNVTVVEGTPGTGDNQAVVQTSSNGQGATCGSTNINVLQPRDSEVWYECNMEQAQVALQVIITNAQSESIALKRQDLIQAIGRGIGNNAAHEIAHQFLILCCSMDALVSNDPGAAGTYNNGEADGDPNPNVINSDPAPYTGFGKSGKPIFWEDATKKGLTNCLGKSWHNIYPLPCAQ